MGHNLISSLVITINSKMEVRHYSSLSEDLLNSYYFPRKKPSQLCLILDLRDTNQDIYPVPVNMEHIDIVSAILNKKKITTPELVAKFIPSNLTINRLERKVTGIVTGISGMEISCNVRHYRRDLRNTHSIVKGFIRRGGFRMISPLEEHKIITRYCINEKYND